MCEVERKKPFYKLMNKKGFLFFLVERMGVEPTTSAVRLLRSPN